MQCTQLDARLAVRNTLKKRCVQLGYVVKKHKGAIRLDRSEKSALAQHAHDQPFTHVIGWSAVEVIDTARQTKERKIQDALPICQQKPPINGNSGVECSTVWSSVL